MIKNCYFKTLHIALMSLLLSSCDSTSTTDTDNNSAVGGSEMNIGGDSNRITNYFGEIAAAFCAKRFECCPDGNFFDTEQECQEWWSDLPSVTAIDQAERGYIIFAEDRATDCIAAFQASLNASSCEDLQSPSVPDTSGIEACQGIFTGVSNEGETCDLRENEDDEPIPANSACVEGLVCSPQDGETSPVCVPPLAVGEACEELEGTECAEGASCLNSVCTQLLGNGESCESDEECDSEDCSEGVCIAEERMCAP